VVLFSCNQAETEEVTTMATAKGTISLLDILRQMGMDQDMDFLRESVRMLVQMLIEAEATRRIGAERYERTAERATYRNGYRERPWETRVGRLELRIPKLREGAFFPSFLEPRRMAEKAIVSVVQEAYVLGVSTRKVDSLVRALGLDGIDKSQVSRMAKELDEQVELFRNRPLEGPYPYVWLDATYVKVKSDCRVLSKALVVALGVKVTGDREILGFAIGPCETGAFWQEFLRSLVSRGLSGVQLVVSDAHEGLKKAILQVLVGTSWQRCTVHFMRNVLAHVPRGAQHMVAAYIRTIFAQPDRETAKAQLRQVAAGLDGRFPRVAEMLYEAEEDILAYMAFPKEHHRQIHSTNPLERLNKEIKRRADVVGIFPNDSSVLRLLGTVMMEQNDEWIVQRRYFSQESMKKLLQPGEPATMLPPVE